MSELFYTAIIQANTNAIEFAEHFDDEAERDKRARQLQGECIGRGEADGWRVYTGDKPVEWTLAFADYLTKHPQTADMEQSERDKIMANASAFADKAKTVSIKAEPEIDDRDEARPLPAWAVAEHEQATALITLADAKATSDAATAKADELDSLAAKTKGNSDLRAEANAARATAEQAAAILYRAEQDYQAKAQTFNTLMAEENKRAEEASKEFENA
jgi:hypothetical protein